MGSLNLSFGALSDPIVEQLANQNLVLDSRSAAKYQDAANSITRLRIMGYMTDSATRSVHQKLMKDIAKNVRELHPE